MKRRNFLIGTAGAATAAAIGVPAIASEMSEQALESLPDDEQFIYIIGEDKKEGSYRFRLSDATHGVYRDGSWHDTEVDYGFSIA